MKSLEMVTNHGLNLPGNMPDDEFFKVGEALAAIERGMQWAIGDWYNAIPNGSKWVGDNGKKTACDRAGLNHRTASDYAAVCRAFSMPARAVVDGVTFRHHRMLAVDGLTGAQRQRLLKDTAANGWSSKQLTQERDKLLGTYVEPVKVDSSDAIREFVEDALPTLPGKYQKQVARAVKYAALKLADDYESTVQHAVDDRIKSERERIRKREHEAKAEMEQAIKIRAGAKQFMTESEFKLVRSLLHPDKHGGDARYVKAFEIFNRLAEQM